MKIAITGHRPNKLGNDYDLTSKLVKAIQARIITELHDLADIYGFGDIRLFTLISGVALGIDTLFAKIAIEYNIPFIAAIPCYGQEARWIEKSRKQYNEIINHPLCTKYYVSDQEYNNHCMQDRNIWMVDNCNVLIAVWNGSSGGTANCVKYAQSVGKEIIRINPSTLVI